MVRPLTLALLALLLAAVVRSSVTGSSDEGPSTAKPLRHVGRATCAGCHEAEHSAWLGSHHDLAMQLPAGDAVRGDFSGASLAHGDETFRFVERDGRPAVVVERGDASDEFPVRYVFGHTPLQQVLLATERGHLQAPPFVWATEEAEGTPRWIALHPEETPPPGDPFHWTGRAHNWNYMCAECHSTAVTRGYDLATDAFSTTYEEIDVSCEACHGPGSRHVEWANEGGETDDAKGFPVRLRRDPEARWVRAEGETTAHREPAATGSPELDTCGRCHSRRTALADTIVPGAPLLDTHRLSLLTEDLYHVDGQILEEVFVLGSFLQSKMHAVGVTCSDCHDAHSGALHLDGNALCVGCHDPSTFDVPAHHHHPEGGAGTACVDCHMPKTHYMEVDPRGDHSFRVPRPDLSVSFGVPNACTGCHTDRDDPWAAETVETWFPEGRHDDRHWTREFARARSGARNGALGLVSVLQEDEWPAIVRATAAAELGALAPQALLAQSPELWLDAADPLLRYGGLSGLPGITPELLPAILGRLDDPILSVRLEATRLLAPARRILDEEDRAKLDARLAEYRTTQLVNADRPEAHLNLGTLALSLGDVATAEESYRRALALEPLFGPAAMNLADLYRATAREAEATAILEETIARSPDDAGLHHSLGLARVRAGAMDAALASLRRAVDLAPGDARYAFVLAVALHDTGDRAGALATLDRAIGLRPREAQLIDLRRTYAEE